MKFFTAFVIASAFLISSCAKEDVIAFDDQISIAEDYAIDASGDTFYRFYMANAFTPNEDGRNDVYIVYGVGMNTQEFEMTIYSREGNLVFATSNPYHSWDGRMQGGANYLPYGLYTVNVSVEDTSRTFHNYVYDVTMFR